MPTPHEEWHSENPTRGCGYETCARGHVLGEGPDWWDRLQTPEARGSFDRESRVIQGQFAALALAFLLGAYAFWVIVSWLVDRVLA